MHNRPQWISDMITKQKMNPYDKFWVAAFVVCGIFMTGAVLFKIFSIDTPEKIAERVSFRIEQLNTRVDAFQESLSEMVFVHDAASDLCFAYLWHGMANGGPAIAHVPCDGIDMDYEFDTNN